jgi:hypothetical protein
MTSLRAAKPRLGEAPLRWTRPYNLFFQSEAEEPLLSLHVALQRQSTCDHFVRYSLLRLPSG